LVKNNQKWNWTEKQDKTCFQEVEGEIYQRTSVSSTRLGQKKIRIEVNVLDYTIEGVLSIEYGDGQ